MTESNYSARAVKQEKVRFFYLFRRALDAHDQAGAGYCCYLRQPDHAQVSEARDSG